MPFSASLALLPEGDRIEVVQQTTGKRSGPWEPPKEQAVPLMTKKHCFPLLTVAVSLLLILLMLSLPCGIVLISLVPQRYK